MNKLLRHLFVIVLIITLAACSTGKQGPPESNDNGNQELKTVVLSEFARGNLNTVKADGTLIFDEATIFPQSTLAPLNINNPLVLTKGNIITSEPTNAAPDGLMRKIESIRNENGKIYIETSEATLEETLVGANIKEGEYTLRDGDLGFESAQILYDPQVINLTDAQWRAPDMLPTDSISSQKIWRFGKKYCFNKDIYAPSNGRNVKVNARGCVDLNAFAELKLRMGMRWFKVYVKEFVARTGGQIDGRATLSANANYSFDKRVTLASFRLGRKAFFIGPVPVVVTTVYTLTMDMEGNITVGTSVTALANLSAEVGARYNRGRGWSPIRNFSHRFDFEVDGRANARAKVALDNQITLYLYGLAGPGFGIAPYVEGNVSYPPFRRSAYAGIDGTLHIDARRIRRSLYWHRSYNIYKWRIY